MCCCLDIIQDYPAGVVFLSGFVVVFFEDVVDALAVPAKRIARYLMRQSLQTHTKVKTIRKANTTVVRTAGFLASGFESQTMK